MKPQAQKNDIVKNSNGNFYLGGQLKSNFEFGSFLGRKKVKEKYPLSCPCIAFVIKSKEFGLDPSALRPLARPGMLPGFWRC